MVLLLPPKLPLLQSQQIYNRSLASGGSNSFLLMGSRERETGRKGKINKKERKQNKYILGRNTLKQQVLQIVAPAPDLVAPHM